MRNKRRKRTFAIILGTVGLATTVYMIKIIRDIGIYADETGTSGAAPLEWILALLGIVLMIMSIILLIKYSIENQ